MSDAALIVRDPRILSELPLHADSVTDAAWSPSGDHVASIGRDRRLHVFRLSSNSIEHNHVFSYPLMHLGFLNDTVLLLCDFNSNLRSYSWADGKVLHTLKVNVERASTMSVAPSISMVALGYKTGLIEFVEYRNERPVVSERILSVPGPVWQIHWTEAGNLIYVSSTRDGVTVYDTRALYILEKFPGAGVFSISESAALIATAQRDHSIYIYNIRNGRRIASLEGSTVRFGKITFTADGAFLIGKAIDGNRYVWATANWKLLSTSHDTVIYPRFPLSGSPINPRAFLTTGSMQRNVVVYELFESDLLDLSPDDYPQYRNCKVVIMGEQGVGKSALANQLLGRGWRLTESTHARRVSRLRRDRVGGEFRELYLWDLAGQPNYHLIHQLHLDDTYIALVMFDDQAERDPFARPRYWDRALSTAIVNSTYGYEGLTKFLVAGRIDRGEPHVSREAIDRFLQDNRFQAYFRTSARTGYGIDPLRDAILGAVRWEQLPSVTSTRLFQDTQQLILDLQGEGVHVLGVEEAYSRLPKAGAIPSPAVEEFRTCVSLLESRGLIRRLAFNDSILFNPEYLDAYASAIVNQARVDPNGLGSVKEYDILQGRFLINQEERIPDHAIERDLIIGTLEDIILRQLAFREITPDGTIIVFPSQFTRENPDLPAPDGIELRITFMGPLQNIYSTTTVRLVYSERFKVTEIWKNGVVVRDAQNHRAGFQVSDFADGHGEIALFFEHGTQPDFKRDLIDFVQQHVFRLAAVGSIRTRKVFHCAECRTEFTDAQVSGRIERGFAEIICSVCSASNPLSGVQETSTISAPSRNTVLAIARAQETAEREANVAVGSAMVQGADIRRWLGGQAAEPHVVVVFTDIVSSTKTNNEIGDIAMEEVRDAHFTKLSQNAARYQGRIVNNTGDGVLAIFKSTPHAAQFGVSSFIAPGHDAIRIRVGIHLGRVQASDNNVFGQTVNFASRVQSALSGAGVVFSSDAKHDFERIHGQNQKFMRFELLEGQELKGFEGKFDLWKVVRYSKSYLTSVR